MATVVATAETELMMLSQATFEKILGPMQVRVRVKVKVKVKVKGEGAGEGWGSE